MKQTILHGGENLVVLLKDYKKVFVVQGFPIDRYSIGNAFNAIPHVAFSGFTPNPVYEEVCAGVNLFRSEGCDAIVAIGGGSAIDVAKCIKLFSGMDERINFLEQEQADTHIPLIAIPTTAGTGSESTRHAVVYYQGRKQSISHPSLVPNAAVLIPELLKGLPLYQKKCTMMDALCQAIESWWSVNSTEESKAYSKKAITKIKENWKEYIENNTPDSATQIMEAANWAGQAINITATTAAHAMSYKITSLYGLPHGHAVAVCMPEVWDYMLEHPDMCLDRRGKGYFLKVMEDIGEIVDLRWFCELKERLDLSDPVAMDRGAELDILVSSVNATRLKNNPVALSADVLRTMYERILK